VVAKVANSGLYGEQTLTHLHRAPYE